jgi:RHS repeat-associated protein
MWSKLTAMRASARFSRKESMRMRGRLRPGAGRGTPVTSWLLGAVLLASGALAQSTFTTRYTFDADGNRTSITYPSGNVVAYAFEYADRPFSAAAGATPLVTSAAYLPFGPETQVVYGNGTTKTMLYDTRYRVQQNKLTGPAGVIAQYDYQEDAAGNITQIHDATDPGFNRDFAYDDLQRLVTANSGDSLWGAGTYNYDSMGNMLSTSVTPAKSFSYEGTTPKLLAVATVGVSHSLSYDAAGNETGYIANRTYSSRNQLLSVTDSSPAGHTIAYGYDGRGIRVTRSEMPVGTGTARSVFTYSPELNLLGVVRDDGPNYDIDWFGSTPVAQSGGAGVRYTFTDHLGTPVLQTDPSGAVIWRAEYDPYGDVRQMRVGTPIDQPLRLPGQELAMNSEGGEESYNIFRWYRSGWGRYTQVDPIGFQGGPNLYAYSFENPETFVDPFGLYCTSDFVQHYYSGNPAALDLASIGLLGPFRHTESVKYATNAFRGMATAKAAAYARSLCPNCKPGLKTGSFSFKDTVTTNVTSEPCLFSVGHSTFFRHADCDVSADCKAHQFSYNCGFNFRIRDKFKDPLDIGIETGGTVYDINADWSEHKSGSGSW